MKLVTLYPLRHNLCRARVYENFTFCECELNVLQPCDKTDIIKTPLEHLQSKLGCHPTNAQSPAQHTFNAIVRSNANYQSLVKSIPYNGCLDFINIYKNNTLKTHQHSEFKKQLQLHSSPLAVGQVLFHGGTDNFISSYPPWLSTSLCPSVAIYHADKKAMYQTGLSSWGFRCSDVFHITIKSSNVYAVPLHYHGNDNLKQEIEFIISNYTGIKNVGVFEYNNNDSDVSKRRIFMLEIY